MARLAATIALLALAACKPDPVTTTPEPTGATTPTVTSGDPPPAAKTPVVAHIGEVEITRKQLEHQLRIAPEQGPDEALLTLVDRVVVAREADRMALEVHEPEIDAAIEGVAQSNGMTVEELEQAVGESAALTWKEYRYEVAVQILEFKVLTYHGTLGNDSTATSEQLSKARDRLVQCLRAAEGVVVDDPDLALPDNPYDRDVTIEGANFHGTLGLTQGELDAIVAKAAPSGPACTVVTEVEPALSQAYLEAGYVKARVSVRWPDQPPEALTLDIDVDSGAVHELGAIVFDQSRVPADQRADEKALRKTVEAHIRPGDVAAISKLRDAGLAVNAALDAAGLAPAVVSTSLHTDKKRAVLDVTYEIAPKV